jgi:HSP20 family protein
MKTARRYNNVFDALYDIFDNDAWMSRSTGAAIPPINIIDSEEQYELEFAVPGMTKEDFCIQIDTNDNLVVTTEKSAQLAEGKRYLHQSFRSTAFRQSIVMPEDVDRNKIKARVENGILYIVLPKLKPEVVKPEVRTIGIA